MLYSLAVCALIGIPLTVLLPAENVNSIATIKSVSESALLVISQCMQLLILFAVLLIMLAFVGVPLYSAFAAVQFEKRKNKQLRSPARDVDVWLHDNDEKKAQGRDVRFWLYDNNDRKEQVELASPNEHGVRFHPDPNERPQQLQQLPVGHDLSSISARSIVF